ncbi:glycosyltransferase [Thalassolituus sp. LLYu03]|uniref:glycosyltransferase n=1 Tax=Thalassolituus sp. LLYu03 TaxID=3421656 RepID=UPI003D266303
MQSKKLVTVYITTCNRPVLLERALQSVLDQSYESIEVIVVDDCSDDVQAYREIAERYRSYGFVFLRNDVRQGACYSRNIAIGSANGLYITGLDDDDFFLPDRIKCFVESWNDDYSFISSGYVLKDSSGERELYSGCREFLYHDILKGNVVGNQIFTLRDRMLHLKGFDEGLPAWQDYDLILRMLKEYGVGLRIEAKTYVIDKSHPHESISKNISRVKEARQIFGKKFAADIGIRGQLALDGNYYLYDKSLYGVWDIILQILVGNVRLGLRLAVNKVYKR